MNSRNSKPRDTGWNVQKRHEKFMKNLSRKIMPKRMSTKTLLVLQMKEFKLVQMKEFKLSMMTNDLDGLD